MTETLSRDAIVLQLRARNVPLDKAEKAADRAMAERERLRGVEPPKKRMRATKKLHKGLSVEQRAFKILCKEHGLPMPATEYHFAIDAKPPRAFRFDYAFVAERVAVENNGGTWRQGGGAHQGKGAIRDMEKQNLAQQLGWKVVVRTPQNLNTVETMDLLKHLLHTCAP